MIPIPQPTARARYGMAVLAVASVMAFRAVLDPVLRDTSPFVLSTLAVTLSAWYGGLGPGLLATVVSALGATVLFLDQRLVLPALTLQAGVRICLFLFVGIVISYLNHAVRTARSRAEESAAQAQADRKRVDSILASISDAFIAFDRNTLITYMNERAAELAHAGREQVMGKSIWTAFPEIGELRPQLDRVIAERKPAHIETSLSALKAHYAVDAYPFDSGICVLMRDITAQRKLEEKMRQKQKLESIGTLAGGIAHEFNNLLTTIVGNTSMVLSDISFSDPNRPRLASIQQASDRAARLTRQMLAYAEGGRYVVQKIDVSGLIQGIDTLIASRISKQVRLEVDLERGLPKIEGDSDQIWQLVLDLMMNAAEAIPGAGYILLRTRLQYVDELYAAALAFPSDLKPGPYVRIDVQDTGCGMSAQTLANIFDPFYTTKFSGRGLGLAAVSGIVRGHRGGLYVYSQPGRGTAFKVLLPVESVAMHTHPEDVEPSLHGTILIVENDEAARRKLKEILEHHGCSVLSARHDTRAISILRKEAAGIGAAICELSETTEPDLQVVRLLQAVRPDAPLILSSGFSEKLAMRDFRMPPGGTFLEKPYEASAVIKTLRSRAGMAAASPV